MVLWSYRLGALDALEQGLLRSQPVQYGLHFVRRPHAQCDLLLRPPEGLVIEARHLLRHGETVLSQRAAPQFILQIDLFHDEGADRDQQPALSLSVAVPHSLTAGSTVYCRADDAPCLRGGFLSQPMGPGQRAKQTEKDLLDLKTSWTIKARGQPLGVVRRLLNDGQGHIEIADCTAVAQWNFRCERDLCPPWKRLSEAAMSEERSLDADDVPSSQCPSWHSQSNRIMALHALQAFLNDRAARSKYLICPESCYGWDLHLLEQKIAADLQRLRTNNLGPLNPIINLVTSRYASARVSLQPRPPALAIRTFGAGLREKVYLKAPWLIDGQELLIFSLMFTILADLVIVISIIMGVFQASSIVVLSTLLFFLSCTAVFGLLAGADPYQSSVHESVGLAWAMKRWIAVPCEVTTRQEAICAVPHAIDAEERDGVWHALIGTRETDWWEQNRTAILTAIRRGHGGQLFIDEMHVPNEQPRPSMQSLFTGDALHQPTTSSDRGEQALPPTYNELADLAAMHLQEGSSRWDHKS